MILARSMAPGWLSNTWLVGDRPGGYAVLIDTGGPTEPILAAIAEHRLTVTHVLCTHHHPDHVAHNQAYKRQFGCPICGHERESDLFGDLDVELSGDEEIVTGDLHVRLLHIPGHTLGQLGFVVNDERVFTGDTLFQGTVGGTRGVGHTSFEDLRHSLLDVLLRMPRQTIVHPGHMDVTTIGAEQDGNPFIEAFRGPEPIGTPCTALGEPAELLLRAPDYDGGSKAWVRWADGSLDVVAGSRVADT